MAEMKQTNKQFLSGLSIEKKSGLAFSAAAVLPVLMATLFIALAQSFGWLEGDFGNANWYLYANFLLSSVSFSLIILFFLTYVKTPVQDVFGKTEWKYYLIAFLLQIGLLSLSELNGLFLQFLGKFGYEHTPIVLPRVEGFGFVGVLFVVGVMPAFAEEGIFRGIMMGGLRQFGQWGAILISGAMFALFHQNPAQTVYQFICGCIYALVAFKAKSALPTMLAHFINNALIVTLYKFGVESYPTEVFIPLMIVSALCLIGGIVYLLVFDKKKEEKPLKNEQKADKWGFLICSAVGVLICLINWISSLISGF